MPDLLIEVGCEELPSSACREIVEQAPSLLEAALASAGVPEGWTATVSVAPRRFAVQAKGLPVELASTRRTVRGPAATAAFDADGAPTKAALGFARGQGITVEDLVVRDDGGREFVFAELHAEGRPMEDLVPDVAAHLGPFYRVEHQDDIADVVGQDPVLLTLGEDLAVQPVLRGGIGRGEAVADRGVLLLHPGGLDPQVELAAVDVGHPQHPRAAQAVRLGLGQQLTQYQAGRHRRVFAVGVADQPAHPRVGTRALEFREIQQVGEGSVRPQQTAVGGQLGQPDRERLQQTAQGGAGQADVHPVTLLPPPLYRDDVPPMRCRPARTRA